ncbi:MAG: class I SAM-dependent methyltransferase, partial [Anaerolineae bacterium]|nr:class I SAM-dependent methyltransferase [Anaerolineae bacterium]
MNTQEQVRQFYDKVGWQVVEDGNYQNARYEDLRPVAREYIHRCHLRVNRHLPERGSFILDAGSGPVQYPEYLTYSENFNYRVCADISIVALMEARKRLGHKGLFVVSDVSNLPFKDGAFDGLVSLHTLHHLPQDGQKKAYREFYRALKLGASGVVVNGWTESILMRRLNWMVHGMEGLGRLWGRLRGRKLSEKKVQNNKNADPTGTYIQKLDADSLGEDLNKAGIPFDIRVWRSVNVRFLRA